MSSLFEKAKETILSQNEKEKESKNTGWVAPVVVGVLVLLMAAFFGFFAWRKGRELAKLKHEKDVADEEALQAAADARLAQDQAERDEAAQRLTDAAQRVQELEERIAESKEKYEETRKQLDRITNWDDVDQYLSR